MPTPTSSDKPKSKIDRIPLLHGGYFWSPWPHEFNRLMLRYQISASFAITLLYLWKATVGSSDDSCGNLALTQIPARRKHVEKWLAALCESGLFKVRKAKLGSQEGSFYSYRENATVEEWEVLFRSLARIELLGGLDDKVNVKQFGEMIARACKSKSNRDEDYAPKRSLEAAFENVTRRKRS